MKKILLDTNLIVALMDQNNSHHNQAKQVFEKIKVEKCRAEVSLIIIHEVLWVAEKLCKLPRSMVVNSLLALISQKKVYCLEQPTKVLIKSLRLYLEGKFDFADLYLNTLASQKNMQIASFDQDFVKMKAPLYQWQK